MLVRCMIVADDTPVLSTTQLLLNVLHNANVPGYRKLSVKSMVCAGLIGKSSRESVT